ncbi:MAG: MptD family putative ECF transporter S component [Lachnospiraceae bacterium]
MNENTNNKMKSRDFITLGIFSVLFIAIFFVCLMCVSFAPILQPFGIALTALAGGPVYMLMRIKVNHFGGIIISGTLYALFMFATGSGWIILVSTIIGAVLADLISKVSNNKSYTILTVGYSVFMAFTALGSYLPYLVMRDYYVALSESSGVNGEFMTAVVALMNGPMIMIAVAAAAVSAILGALLAHTMLKKHFIKSGMVKEVA